MLSTSSSLLLGFSLFVGSGFAAPAPAPALDVDSYKAEPSASYTGVELGPTPFAALTDSSQVPVVQELAHGTLPNGPPPPPGAISAEGITNLQLIELNEFFETAFFASLLSNVTKNVPGFEISDQDERNFVIDALVSVIAQEELHALNANGALKSQNQDTIKPCTFKFPTSNFADAVGFAATFTDVVLGVLQDVIEIFAKNGDTGITRGVASVVGQEGQQSGFYRILQNKNKIPSELPFLTTGVRDFAFSSLEQGVIVSCPNDDILKKKLKLFGVLNLLTKVIDAKDQSLQFSFDIKSLANSNIITGSAAGQTSYPVYGTTYGPGYDWSQVSLVYINQQNTPVVEKLQNVNVAGSVVTFNVDFPYSKFLMNGLTLAAVTKSAGPFANAQAVANQTLFAPAFIEIN